MKRETIGYIVLAILALIALSGMLISSPIVQDQAYHNFSDIRTGIHVPNFGDVVSNLSFLIVGFIGLLRLKSIAEEKTPYFMFFLGISLVSIGSAYYHLEPNNDTLVWDRLPMTIAFMSLCSIVISEFISEKKGRFMLIPLLIIGLLSIVYWVISNDLRFYMLVQFYPMLAIPVVLIFFKSKYNLTIGYWLLLLAYVIAKLFEHFDQEIHHSIGFISGHTLKHLCASIGLFVLLYTYIKRRKVSRIR